MNPRPFATPEVAFHFLASTASAVPDEPGPAPAWRHPDRVAHEGHFRRRAVGSEAAVMYLALVCEGVADVLAEGDVWVESATLALSIEARLRALVEECSSAVLAGVTDDAYGGIAARVEEALHTVNAFAEGDTFWEDI